VGEKDIVHLFIGKSTRSTAVATTTTTTLHIYYYYLYNYKFTIYYLWHWKSHFGFNYQDIILKKVMFSQTSKLLLLLYTATPYYWRHEIREYCFPLFDVISHIQQPVLLQIISPGLEKHLDRGFLLNISRYNFKKLS
jgi:hypothetical protein